MLSRRTAGLAWSAIPDLGMQLPGTGILGDHDGPLLDPASFPVPRPRKWCGITERPPAPYSRATRPMASWRGASPAWSGTSDWVATPAPGIRR